ncbi:MAG: DUF3119 family protein [Snowella sp.]|nr:DUF3119 family protein [Snowella sp.]
MTTTQNTPINDSIVELSPSYAIPFVFIGAAIALLFWLPWVSLPIGLFGLFLFFQTVTLRLQFTQTDLDVYRSSKLIRRFPYAEWQNWRIYWEPVPILFYFKEVKSIHFLPIIFDPKALKTCLEKYCPYMD